MLNLSPKQRKWLMYGNVVVATILLIVPFYRYERWYFAVIMSGLNGVSCLSVGLALYFAKHEDRLSLQQWQYFGEMDIGNVDYHEFGARIFTAKLGFRQPERKAKQSC